MLNCSGDPLENYLKGFGYSVVLLPRDGIQPLQVATMKASRQLQLLGGLVKLFQDAPAPPDVTRNTASNLVGAQSAGLKVGVGLKLLGSALAAIGVKALSGSAGFDKASQMRFQFSDVTVASAQFLDLVDFLDRAGPVRDIAAITAMFAAESLFVITDVLYAQTLTIDAEDSEGREAAIDLPGIQGVLDGKASVKTSGGRSSRIELTSATPLAFGIKAVQIFQDGQKLSTRFVDPAEMKLEANPMFEPEPLPVFLVPDAVLADPTP